MQISQESYDSIRAELDASEQQFGALQRYPIDWDGQAGTVAVRVRRRSKRSVRKSGSTTTRLPDARQNGSRRGTVDSEALEVLLINSNAADVGVKAVFHMYVPG
jgi:hypothetical protein